MDLDKELIKAAYASDGIAVKAMIKNHIIRYENRLIHKININERQCVFYLNLWKSIEQKLNNTSTFLENLSTREMSEISDAILSGELEI